MEFVKFVWFLNKEEENLYSAFLSGILFLNMHKYG